MNALMFSVGVFFVSFIALIIIIANNFGRGDETDGYSQTVIFVSAILSFGISLMIYGGLV